MKMLTHLTFFQRKPLKSKHFQLLKFLTETILNGWISSYCRSGFCLRTLLVKKNSWYIAHTFSFLAMSNAEKLYTYT